MTSLVGKLLVAGFLVPAAVVFAVAYRHALRHWLRPVAPIPTATIASQRGAFDRVGAARHFHAAAIATAFASVSVMTLIAVTLIVVAIAGSLHQ